MEVISVLLNTLLPVFILVIIGYLIGKKKDLDVSPIIDFIVYISVPSLVITSLSKTEFDFSLFSKIISIAFIVIITQVFLFMLVLKICNSKKIGLTIPAFLGNTAFLGYPVCLFAFGELGLSNAIVYDLANAIFLFSIGIYLIHHKNSIKEIFKLPLIYAVTVGLLLNISKITIPLPIAKPLEMLGTITIPLALMLLGFKLTKIKFSSFKTPIFVVLFRMLGGFTVAFLILKLVSFFSFFSLSDLSSKVILLQASMPSGIMSIILTQKYGRDPETVASVVFLSTVLSLISIPLILIFLS